MLNLAVVREFVKQVAVMAQNAHRAFPGNIWPGIKSAWRPIRTRPKAIATALGPFAGIRQPGGRILARTAGHWPERNYNFLFLQYK